MTEQLTILHPETEPEEESRLNGWALVELYGHQRIVGKVTEQSFGTGVLFRVDVPDLIKANKVQRKGFTRYFGLGAIYSITPIDENMMKQLLPSIDGIPTAP